MSAFCGSSIEKEMKKFLELVIFIFWGQEVILVEGLFWLKVYFYFLMSRGYKPPHHNSSFCSSHLITPHHNSSHLITTHHTSSQLIILLITPHHNSSAQKKDEGKWILDTNLCRLKNGFL
jgi:hypothetical protein